MANKGMTFPPEILTRFECQRLISSFSLTTATGIRNRSLIATYLRSLLRCAEATSLAPSDVNFRKGSITIQKGKGSKRRVVGMDRRLSEEIQKWMDIRPESEYLFCTLDGGKLDNSYIRKTVKRAGKRARIERRVHPHGLRHTGSVQLLEEGVDIRIISRQLGHSNLATTHTYLNHLSPEDLLDAFRERA